jgi:hypothetical protein
MAENTTIGNFRDGTIVALDGAALTHTFSYDPGDFKISGLGKDLYEIQKYLVRGELASVRKGNRRFPSFSFTIYQTDFTEGPLPVFMKANAWSAATSTLGSSADVWAFALQLTLESSDYGGAHDHRITIDDCVATIDFAEGDPNAFTVQGEILGSITIADV